MLENLNFYNNNQKEKFVSNFVKHANTLYFWACPIWKLVNVNNHCMKVNVEGYY